MEWNAQWNAFGLKGLIFTRKIRKNLFSLSHVLAVVGFSAFRFLASH
jgi:hypothetical protein